MELVLVVWSDSLVVGQIGHIAWGIWLIDGTEAWAELELGWVHHQGVTALLLLDIVRVDSIGLDFLGLLDVVLIAWLAGSCINDLSLEVTGKTTISSRQELDCIIIWLALWGLDRHLALIRLIVEVYLHWWFVLRLGLIALILWRH